MSTGTAFGIANCLGWWKAAYGYTTNPGDLVVGGTINKIADLSGAGNTMTLHSGSTGAKASIYQSSNQAGGWTSNAGISFPTGANGDGKPYAEILFDGTGANVYDIPSGAMPTGTNAPGTNGNDMTLFVVVRNALYAPMLIGGWQYPMGIGWYGGSLSSGARLDYGIAPPGSTPKAFPTQDYPDFYTPTVLCVRCRASDGTTTLFNNLLYAETNTNFGNVFNQPMQKNNNNAGTIGGYLGNYPGDAGTGATASAQAYDGYWSESVLYNTALTDVQIQTIIGQIFNGMGLPLNTGVNRLAIIGDSLWKGAWAGTGTPVAGVDDPYYQTNVGGASSSNPPMFESSVYQLSRYLGPTWKIVDTSSPGYMGSQAVVAGSGSLSRIIGCSTTPALAAGGKTAAIVELGSNDINNGASAVTVTGYITTCLTQLKSAGYNKVLANTITHRGTTTSTANTAIDTLNTWIRSGSGGSADGYIDWAFDPRLETIGAPNSNIYIRADDNVHTRMPGSAVKAELAVKVLNAVVINPPSTLAVDGSQPVAVVSNQIFRGQVATLTVTGPAGTYVVTSSVGDAIPTVVIAVGKSSATVTWTPTASGTLTFSGGVIAPVTYTVFGGGYFRN